MGKVSKQLYEKAKKAGKTKEKTPFLKLAKKVYDDNNNFRGTKSTGKHMVELVDEKIVKESTYNSDEPVEQVEYKFKEKGEERIYRKPVHTDDGNLHYFVRNMAKYDKGDKLELEYIDRGDSGYIETHLAGEPEAPEDYESSQNKDTEDDVEEVDLESIPF